MTTSKVCGVNHTVVSGDPQYEALMSNNPNISWYWSILRFQPDILTSSVKAQVTIIYYCKLIDRVDVATS